MHISSLAIITAVFSQLTGFVAANPPPVSSISPPSCLSCANAPNTAAGTSVHRNLPRSPPSSIQARTSNHAGVCWCRPSSTTFIRISFINAVSMTSGAAIQQLLDEVAAQVDTYIRRTSSWSADTGDRVIDMSEPTWQMAFEQFTVYPLTSRTSGGGMTYRTLRRALGILQDFMTTVEPGTGMVKVWEGPREVGTIVIGGS